MAGPVKDATSFQKLLAKYDYTLPPKRIAISPASPRDSAKLMVFDRQTGRTTDARFCDLPKYLPKGSLLVFNDTKVVPARLVLKKPTGGAVRALFVDLEGKNLRALADRPVAPGAVLSCAGRPAFRVEGREDRYVVLSPLFQGTVRAYLERHGDAPLPPYIKNTPLGRTERRRRYQTIFARRDGSIAAPTASLHFTPRLLAALKKAGIETAFVTLHVGLGTFAPLTPEQLQTGRLHQERYSIDKKTAARIERAKKADRPIIPVGTTSLRTLESAAVGHKLKKLRGATELFIRPGYRFKMADGLITNFHVPRSSLLMLVAALCGDRADLLRLYRGAIKKGYRFFSFGDGMLVL